ncbi:unnamed protein product, partial [Adineta steineri]
ADNLNHIDENETISPIPSKKISSRRSLPVPYQSQSPMFEKKISSRRSLPVPYQSQSPMFEKVKKD